MGCGHGCVYCDGRAEKYYVQGNFNSDIIGRTNLPDLLQKELPRIREYGPVSLSSGITDAYQPIEEKVRLTRGCAEVFRWHGLPVTVLTKSDLILRDLDCWSEVQANAGFTLLMTITTLDEQVAAAFEPGAPSVARRLKTLEAFSRADCATGALVMPVLPGFSDGEQQIRQLYGRLIDAGVSCIIPGWLTLRPGRQKDYYFRALESGKLDLTQSLYEKELQSGNPHWQYRQEKQRLFGQLQREFRIASCIPHRVYQRTLHKADMLYMVLLQMEQWYDSQGVDISRLTASRTSYEQWLLGQKKSLGSIRGSGEKHDMDGLITRARASGDLEQVISNAKLWVFLQGILDGTACFEPWVS